MESEAKREEDVSNTINTFVIGKIVWTLDQFVDLNSLFFFLGTMKPKFGVFFTFPNGGPLFEM